MRGTAIGIAMALARDAQAAAGPPFLTDDPDTPGHGRCEVVLASTLEQVGGDRAVEAPSVDVALGIGSRCQVKVESAWLVIDEDDGAASGLGETVVGVKTRLIDAPGHHLALSVYPQLASDAPARRSPDRMGGTRTYLLPLEVAYEVGAAAIVGEIGRSIVEHEPDECFGGVLVAHPIGAEGEIGCEVHATRTDGGGTEAVADLGGRWSIRGAVTALVSIGRRVTDGGPDLIAFIGCSFTL